MPESKTMPDSKAVLHAVTLAAKILLQSGAEMYRVQDTVVRIFEHYGVQDFNVYVLANGFFINVDEHSAECRTAIRFVPLQGANLGNVARVNQISRAICEDRCTLEEAVAQMKELKRGKLPSRRISCLLSGVGAGTFAYLFQGTVFDALLSFFLGVILQLVLYATTKTSRYFAYLIGALVVTVGAATEVQMFPSAHMDSLVVGAIIPMVPGGIFTTSINEMFKNDHLSGTIHLMDAVMTAVCIAIGVGGGMVIQRVLWG